MPINLRITIPSKLGQRLDQLAKREESNRSEVVSEALRLYLDLKEFERLRAIGVAAARRRGLFTDEDIFKIVS